MTRWLGALLVGLACVLVPLTSEAQQTPSGLSCNKSAIYDNSTSGSTQIIAAGEPIYICGYSFFAAGTVNVKLVYGTGTNCATGATAMTPAYQFTQQTGLVDPSPYFRGMGTPINQAVCINASQAIGVQAVVYYAQNIF